MTRPNLQRDAEPRTEAPSAAPAIRERAAHTASELSRSFGAVIESLPGRPGRPTDVSRMLGVNKNLAHRIATALTTRDPLAALLAMPGPAPLARFAELARAKGAPEAVCQRAAEAARQFDDLIRTAAGDRTSFDAMASAWVPESRTQIDTGARQSVYRGMRQVLGVSGETQLNSYIFHPNADDAERVDLLVIDAQLGVRRVRPGGRVCLTIHSLRVDHCKTGETSRRLLTDYSDGPPPEFTLAGPPDRAIYELQWNETVGPASSRDIVIAELHRGGFRRRRKSDATALGCVAVSLTVPVRRYIADVLIHRDIYPGALPEFRVLTTGLKGFADANDPTRESDRIDFDTELSVHAPGHAHATPTPEAPFYRRLLEDECAALGWDPRAFRSFRVRFDYPIFDSQMQWVIPLPGPPVEGA